MRLERAIDPEGVEVDELHRALDFRGLRVLEIGCGDGRLTQRFARETAAVLATDPDEERIAYARSHTPPELRDRVRFEVAAADELDVPRASVDLVFFSWSL
jgi:ubiquinone/menaquinone biosynthesis C-methylase UbiE